MRDAFILIFFLVMTGLAIYRPWLMTLAYLYVDLIQPQRLTYYLLGGGRISLIFAILSVLFFLPIAKKNIRISVTQCLMLTFIAWFTFTTSRAIIPDDLAWIRWNDGWKAVGFSIFLPFVLATRRRLESAIAVSVLCIALVTISAGLKTAMGSGGYGELRMIVPVNNGIYESSTIATIGIAAIPLILYLYNHSPLVPRNRFTLLFVAVLIGCSLLTMVGVEARTGLVCLVALAGMMWFRSRYKLPIMAALVAVGIAALPILPQSFTDRMKTIAHPKEDVSASTRTQMWGWTLNFVQSHPLGGGFRVYRLSKFVVEIPERDRNGFLTGHVKVVPEVARAFHSSYFEVLGEHGWPGLILYLSIIGSALVTIIGVRRRALVGPPEAMWQAHLARALFRAVVIYAIGGLFVGLSMQTTLYTLIAFCVSLAHLQAEHRVTRPMALALRARRMRPALAEA